MTKTKRQLRAEAVERLKDAQTDNLEWMLLGDECPNWVNYDTLSYNKAVRERVADLLTDDDSTISEDESTTESLSDGADSREKLEADVRSSLGFTTKDVIEWLDRQAAITEREHPGLTISDDESLINWHGRNYLLQSRVLNAERERDEFSLKLKHEMELNRDNRNAHDLERIAELTAEVDKLTDERDDYREKLSRALDLAHEIVRLQP